MVQTIQNAEAFAGVLFRCAVVTFVVHPLQLLYLPCFRGAYRVLFCSGVLHRGAGRVAGE